MVTLSTGHQSGAIFVSSVSLMCWLIFNISSQQLPSLPLDCRSQYLPVLFALIVVFTVSHAFVWSLLPNQTGVVQSWSILQLDLVSRFWWWFFVCFCIFLHLFTSFLTKNRRLHCSRSSIQHFRRLWLFPFRLLYLASISHHHLAAYNHRTLLCHLRHHDYHCLP